MAEYIKTYIRVRPSVATDPPGGGCLSVKGENQIEVKRDGEKPKTVDKVFNDMTDNSGVWDVIGGPAMEYLGNGKQVVIYAYGETGSGKTYTVRGPNNGEDMSDSIIGKVLGSLAGNEEANLTVVYVHNDTVQDLINGSDGLKMKVDDSGVALDGATTVRIPNANAGFDHIKKCIAKRNEFFEKTPFDETTTFMIYIFGQGAGKLTIIECCGSERCYHAPLALSPEKNKEVQNKNKLQFQLNRCWIESATNADPKIINWKENKVLNRFLQPGLSAGMDQVGFACQIVHLTNHKDRMYEAVAACQYAESSIKQESLKTVGEYKEYIAELEERMEANNKDKPVLQQEMNSEEANAKKVKAENEARLEELIDKSKALDMKVIQTRATYEKEIDKIKKDIEKKKADLEKKNAEEVDRMRNLAKNAPAQAAADIKKKVAEVEEEHKQTMKKAEQEMAKLKQEVRGSKDQFDKLRLQKEQLKLDEQDAMKPVKDLEKELFKLKANMTFAMKNREDGLSPEELLVKRPMWEVRDECDDIDDDLQRLVPDCQRLEQIVDQKIGKPAESESDKSDDESEKSSASAASEKPPPETKEERLERLAREKEERRLEREEEKKRRIAKATYDREWKHFRETTRKDQFLSDLLEKILMYLEYGTNVTTLSAQGLERRFLFFAKGRKQLTFVPAVRDGAVPNRKDVIKSCDMSKVAGIHMGQHSPFFQIQLRKFAGRVDPARSEPPPPVEELDVSNMHRYYYRSFSIQFPTKEEGFVDFICDTDTDFEALVVALHRVSGRNATWGKNLFIELAANIDNINEAEKLLCETNHLTPDEYLNCKELILLKDDKLFVTLHDLRVLTALDLYHSQKLLEMWLKQKWVVRRQVNYYKYQEVIAEEKARIAAQEEAEREAALHAEEQPEEAAEEGDDDDGDDDDEDED